VSVCFSAPYLKKIDAARIIRLDEEMFHDESWKLETHLFWAKGHESQNIAGVGLCTIVNAGFGNPAH